MTRYHALFISDAHLGSRFSKSRRLQSLLQSCSASVLYLVGDFLDHHSDSDANWEATHTILQEVLFGRNYSRVVMTPGNHDSWLNHHHGSFGKRVLVTDVAMHVCLDGRRLAVTHGHQFDWVTSKLPVAALMASALERTGRKALHAKSGSSWIRSANHIASFLTTGGNLDQKLTAFACKHRVEGVVTGHFHEPRVIQIGNLTVADCGDWIDNCTAVAEDITGIHLIDWGHGSEIQT